MEYNKEYILRQVDRYFQFMSVCDIVNDSDYLGQGVSRTAYSIPDEEDFVLKFGVGECPDEYDGNEYINDEIKIFQDAEEEGLSQYFLPVEKLGEMRLINDMDENYYGYESDEYSDCEGNKEESDDDDEYMYITYAIQPRISHTLEEEMRKQELGRYDVKSYKKEKKALSSRGKDFRNYDTYALPFIREYGVDEFLKFKEFAMHQGLCDLHTGNWGYYEGKVVCIDYAM
jgi:hypothetical protein